jgi:hypothetical protein
MVGVQGVGVAEGAYQLALAYARDRRQGRSPWSPDRPALLFDHPDVRRMLALMKARIAASRAICFSAGVAADLARLATDEGERRKAGLRAELLTPIAKAWSTDAGVEVASLGLQVHGGMGFIEETGAAQFYRDARITPIYEGTNGIQAMDLAGRKLAMEGGEAVRDLIAEMADLAAALHRDEGLRPIGDRLAAGVTAVEKASAWLADKAGSPDALAGATAYLSLFGDVLGGALLAKGALAEDARAPLARVYADDVLARAPSRAAAVMMGAEALAAVALA